MEMFCACADAANKRSASIFMTSCMGILLGSSGEDSNATSSTGSAAEERLLQVVLHRLVAEPDAQQRAVEVLAGDRLAHRRAVDREPRGAAGPVERDGHALLRLLDLGDQVHQLLEARLE